MEQLDQLKTMRNQAAERLDAAMAALEKSPDAKLVRSLTSLISELEEALGLSSQDEMSAPASDEIALEAVEGGKIEAVETALSSAAKDWKISSDTIFSEEAPIDSASLSLEESLEAELLSDAGSDGKQANA